MEGVQGRRRLWKDLKRRLKLKGIGFCGSSWSAGVPGMNPIEDPLDEEEDHYLEQREAEPTTLNDILGQIPANRRPNPPCAGQIPVLSGMNLATALAAERNHRHVVQATPGPPAAPLMSLMRLFEEMDGKDGKRRKSEEGVDGMCCVCIERSKGAAFIPCGHTFCRVCSRELWLNRGFCPLCNRSIVEILDIF